MAVFRQCGRKGRKFRFLEGFGLWQVCNVVPDGKPHQWSKNGHSLPCFAVGSGRLVLAAVAPLKTLPVSREAQPLTIGSKRPPPPEGLGGRGFASRAICEFLYLFSYLILYVFVRVLDTLTASVGYPYRECWIPFDLAKRECWIPPVEPIRASGTVPFPVS